MLFGRTQGNGGPRKTAAVAFRRAEFIDGSHERL